VKIKYLIQEIVKDELEERKWSASYFSEKSGASIEEVQRILDGSIHITPELAEAFGRAFGTSTDLWLNLGDLELEGTLINQSRKST
jgi:plasmid maintenance system antidote protein VapI